MAHPKGKNHHQVTKALRITKFYFHTRTFDLPDPEKTPGTIQSGEEAPGITLLSVKDPASASPQVSSNRLTTGSMPNLTPANNPLQAGFLGDTMWLAVDNRGRPNVVWSDTRGMNDTVEEDIYFATLP